MPLSLEEVRHVAALARLELEPEEERLFAEQLGAVLEYVRKLEELELDGVEPTSHVVAVEHPLREDRVTNRPRPEELLANTPERDGNFVKVPKILE
ncbi:MAG: aspartyl/glutamyl-tRNA(Asn/Gln) amidotransferase subunit C [Candidatus Binatia bacterium]|nr:MAG: aspartyl/glutamyl-tRNA(Asn/Gln) amidotransferase subunit C [Candidatus Binatia bacterium]